MSWETVLFDLDGTLTDSGEGIVNALVYTAEKLKLPHREPDFYRAFIGPPLVWSFQTLLGMDEETAREGVRMYREYYVKKGIWENYPYPGIRELLRDLQAAGKQVMVATSKPETMATAVVERFELMPHLDYVAGASLDESWDQKAEAIRRCLERAAGRAVMVGDRSHDVRGAIQNGIPCIGVLYGFGSREELETAGAIEIAETVEALRTLLLG